MQCQIKDVFFVQMYTSSTIVHDAYMRLYRIGYPVFVLQIHMLKRIAASMWLRIV